MSSTVTVKNVSDATQVFTGFAPFEPGATRKVSKEEAEILLRSPFIEEDGRTTKGTEAQNTMKGVESEDRSTKGKSSK